MDIEEAFNRHQDRLMSIPGVTGLGIGERDGRPAIVVMVKQLTPELRTSLPTLLDGHPVVVEESGEVVAF